MALSNPNALFFPCFFFLFISCNNTHYASSSSVHIIHMDKSHMPKVLSSPHHWYGSIVSSLSKEPSVLEEKLVYTYDDAFHGFSAKLTQDELKALENQPGFLSSHPDRPVEPDTTHSPDFLGLNTASGLWPASQLGKDVIIGMVDSGIWPESPSFGDAGMTRAPKSWKGSCRGAGPGFNSSLCNGKIIGARYFNRGAMASGTTIDVNSSRDTDGHGTHVASIAAGNFVPGVSFFGYGPGTARGAAPLARLSIYKVLWNGGSTESDVVAGIDRAVADGVHIISVSIGFGNGNLYENPLAIASFGARKKGIMVCLSGGNNGPGLRTVTSAIPWAVVVAAGTVDRWFAGRLTLGNGRTITGWSTFPARPVVRNLPVVNVSACDSESLAGVPKESIVVCDATVGNSDFRSIVGGLIANGIRASVIITSEERIFRSGVFPHPGVVVTPSQGVEVARYASRSSSPRANIEFQETIIGPKPRPAPALSEAQSRGPGRGYENILKPDIMAPGVMILAAFNPKLVEARIGDNVTLTTNYTFQSGSSMACPHVSGTAALLKAAHPDWSPEAIQSAMMTTAYNLDNAGRPIKISGRDLDATALGLGAGHIDPNRALNPGLVYDASVDELVALVCSMNFTREQTRSIVRSSYNCSESSADLNYPSFITLFRFEERGKRITKKFTRTLTNVGDGLGSYRAELEMPENSTVRVRPKSLVFGKKFEKKSYTLTVRYWAEIDNPLKVGSITWVEKSGKYEVRSPIVLYASADNFES